MKIDEEKIKNEYAKQTADFDKSKLDELLNKKELLEKFLHNKKFIQLKQDLVDLYSLISDYAKGRYKNVPWWTISSIGAALLYLINPFDIIPDFIPVLGFIDDFFVLSLCIKMTENDIKKYKQWKEQNSVN